MRKPYATALTDIHWEFLRPLVPEVKPGGQSREDFLREVINTLLSQDRTGCHGEMVPHDLPPRSTAFDDFELGRDDGTCLAFVAALRVKNSREGRPRRR